MESAASYEEERARVMRENQEFLIASGLLECASEMSVAPRKQQRTKRARDDDTYNPTREFELRRRTKRVSYAEDNRPSFVPRARAKPGKSVKRVRRTDPGRRMRGDMILDSRLGTTCHQCRQKTTGDQKIACTSCTGYIHYTCLMDWYGEDANELDHSAWVCLKCRGECRCSICRRRRGMQPTGGAESRATRSKTRRPRRSASELLSLTLPDADQSDDATLTSGSAGDTPQPVRTSARLATSDSRKRLAALALDSDDDDDDDDDRLDSASWCGWKYEPLEVNFVVLV
ncbi:hypothetical protein GGF46_001560 [Coemansia sp. RSA 552]|nr:hypothetical protein GGF46_001560 [Coemansia sp. RSA 552]